MNKSILGAILGIATLAAVPAAAGVPYRQYHQSERIHRGVRSSELTRPEMRHVVHQQRSIGRQEQRMRWRHDGRLTAHDRWVLNHRQNRASHHIYRAKHNYRVHG